MHYADKKKIGWALMAWNPKTGCKRGCPHCYARRIAKGLAGSHGYPAEAPFMPTFHPDRLQEPLQRKKPASIFVVDMGDLWGEWVPRDWIQQVLEVVQKAEQHDFMFLTQNPKRYLSFDFPFNAILGVTHQTRSGDYRIDLSYLKAKADLVFCSLEPLHSMPQSLEFTGIDQVIIGAESSPEGERPTVLCQPHWVGPLVSEARRIGAKVFLKNHLPLPMGMERHQETLKVKRGLERFM